MKKRIQKFEITDLDKFVECSRVLVFDSMGKDKNCEIGDIKHEISELSDEELSELDRTLTQEESLLICKKFLTQRKDSDRFIISNKKYIELIDALNSRMVSNMLNSLVNRGLLETAYDTESNDFVFWVKEDEENKKS
jgi:hypothetical protein